YKKIWEMNYLGIDLGTSSIKLAVIQADTGKRLSSVNVPDGEMSISVLRPGWAEQNPNDWWAYVKQGFHKLEKDGVNLKQIQAIGITYQMHGMVLCDKNLDPIRPAIIWSDSRAAKIGEKYYSRIGRELCQEQILGSPGNFTVAKL